VNEINPMPGAPFGFAHRRASAGGRVVCHRLQPVEAEPRNMPSELASAGLLDPGEMGLSPRPSRSPAEARLKDKREEMERRLATTGSKPVARGKAAG
jgi:hypothetical protein